MFTESQEKLLAGLSEQFSIPLAKLLAVCEVESGGRVSALVAGREEPLIRFEGHYFHRLLGTAKRHQAVAAGLASARAGKVRNPRSQAARWKLLERASRIDRPAALQSTSWGIGQVMGAHWQWLSYASVDDMVARARSGIEGQAELMLRYIRSAGLDRALREGDWQAFARGYNGPAFARHGYDRKLAAAHRRHLGETRVHDGNQARHQPLHLRMGDRGEAVVAMQKRLRAHGHAIRTDGDFGPLTHSALLAFQQGAGLAADGIAGPRTFLALERPPVIT